MPGRRPPSVGQRHASPAPPWVGFLYLSRRHCCFSQHSHPPRSSARSPPPPPPHTRLLHLWLRNNRCSGSHEANRVVSPWKCRALFLLDEQQPPLLFRSLPHFLRAATARSDRNYLFSMLPSWQPANRRSPPFLASPRDDFCRNMVSSAWILSCHPEACSAWVLGSAP